MGGARLEPLRVRVTPADMFEALGVAWRALWPAETPTRDAVRVLVAQWAQETGGGKAMVAYNVAGLKSVPNDGHDWTVYQTHEVIGGQARVVTARFRAYESLADGCRDYLQLLRNKRYAGAWPFVVAGQHAAFVHAIKLAGYFTGSETVYAANVKAWFDRFESLPPATWEIPPPPPCPGDANV